MELTDPTGLEQVRDFMLSFYLISEGHGWATLKEIAEMTGVPETGVSAILSYLQKTRHEGYILGKRHRENIGTYEYQVRKRVDRCNATTLFSDLNDPPSGTRLRRIDLWSVTEASCARTDGSGS